MSTDDLFGFEPAKPGHSKAPTSRETTEPLPTYQAAKKTAGRCQSCRNWDKNAAFLPGNGRCRFDPSWTVTGPNHGCEKFQERATP